MLTWRIWGYDFKEEARLKPLIIKAESFDAALREAREINKWYEIGQPLENQDTMKP